MRQHLGTATVSAKTRWNLTGIHLVKDVCYSFDVPPNQLWYDWKTACGPDGYSSPQLRPFENFRRIKDANWFALIGSVNSENFVIGSGRNRFVSPESGELCCYANDLSMMYWNNRGAITLEVYQETP